MTVVSQLWNTAVKNDKVAVSYFWAGSKVNIGGLYAIVTSATAEVMRLSWFVSRSI